MTLNQQSIRKLFREHFKGDRPIHVPNDQRAVLAETIKKRLSALTLVEVQDNRYVTEREKERFICAFSIKNPAERFSYHSRNYFRLLTDDHDLLTIMRHSDSALISDIDEILVFIATCQEGMERKQTLKKRRDKVRDLKSHAIVAQVKKLAKEEKFDFYTESDTAKLKLHIKFSEKESIELQIPFKTFQEVLPHLRSAILSLRELHDRGIKLSAKSLDAYQVDSGRWIRHESL